MLTMLLNVPAGIGYPLLFAFVAAESAGALVPGETSLIVAAALAAQGRLSLPFVIAVAAGVAIIGDNVGYLIGRNALRRLVDRPGRWAAGRRRLVERGEVFFARRGSAAVFFGRWLPGMRVVTSWLAGANRMRWQRFLLWNALGGISWAATIGVLAYLLGRSASGSLGAIGFVGLGVAVVVYLVVRLRRRLLVRSLGNRHRPRTWSKRRDDAGTQSRTPATADAHRCGGGRRCRQSADERQLTQSFAGGPRLTFEHPRSGTL